MGMASPTRATVVRRSRAHRCMAAARPRWPAFQRRPMSLRWFNGRTSTATVNDDLAAIYKYGDSDMGSCQERVQPTAWRPGPGTAPYRSGPGNWEWDRTKPVVGDFNGDGQRRPRCDLQVRRQRHGRACQERVGQRPGRPIRWATPYRSGPGNWEWDRTKPVVGDFNGDGHDDLAAIYKYGDSDMGVLVKHGSSLAYAGPVWTAPYRSGPGNWEWDRTKPVVGDFNGDGHDDLAAIYKYGDSDMGVLVKRGSPTGLTPGLGVDAPYRSGPGNWEWDRTKPVVGDFNGDGHDDLAAIYKYGDSDMGMLVKSGTARPDARARVDGPVPQWPRELGMGPDQARCR